jgi:predicted amidophosphoribosyltransferase
MALHKCPKCELNYVRDGEEYCEVCRREMKRAQTRGRHTDEETDDDEVVMCSECGEAPAVRGSDLCAACLREQKRQVELENAAEAGGRDEEFSADEEELEGEETESEEE